MCSLTDAYYVNRSVCMCLSISSFLAMSWYILSKEEGLKPPQPSASDAVPGNTNSTRHLWSWQFAMYSPSLYFLSFHQTTHCTVIDVLHTLERTSCIKLEAKTKIQIFHLKLHWSKRVDNLSQLWKCFFPGLILLCRKFFFPWNI